MRPGRVVPGGEGGSVEVEVAAAHLYGRGRAGASRRGRRGGGTSVEEWAAAASRMCGDGRPGSGGGRSLEGATAASRIGGVERAGSGREK